MAVRRLAGLPVLSAARPVLLGHRIALADALTRIALGIRGRHLVLIDLFGTVAGAYLAIGLRLDRFSAPLDYPAFLPIVVLLVAVRLGVNIARGLYRRRWRFASIPELQSIVVAATLGSLVAAFVFYGADAVGRGGWTAGFPRSFWPIELLLSVAILGGVRFTIRAANESRGRRAGVVAGRRPTLLYGAGEAGVLVARTASRHAATGVLPVGFLDDNPTLAGGVIAGLKVFGGVGAMGAAIRATGATSLLITMPSAPGAAVRRVVDEGLAHGLDVRTVPDVSDLINGSIDGYRIRKVRVEDLLRRPMVTEHAVNVEDIIRDRTVLITGGAGSIGSELARQVYAMRPRRLVLVDRAESPLYFIQRELETMRARGRADGELRIHLANVASRPAMDRLVAAEAPSVIFHAAAYKHVPMMEEHPSDAAHVNMGGTMALLDAAASAGVARFVLVSTDKAVKPSSVMGASKRIAEMLVADTARRTGLPYVSVRFGNVLGSNGSVVPIFQDQLENGQPLTITHPDMTRYFMTIPEAAWLILDAAAMGRTGDLFVLDMGQPVKVIDLAYDLVRLAGRDPGSQPIEVMGLRPGEKLHEELFYDVESVEPTPSPKVRRAKAPGPPAGVREDVWDMLALATGGEEARLRRRMLAYVATEAAAADQGRRDETPPAGRPGGELRAVGPGLLGGDPAGLVGSGIAAAVPAFARVEA